MKYCKFLPNATLYIIDYGTFMQKKSTRFAILEGDNTPDTNGILYIFQACWILCGELFGTPILVSSYDQFMEKAAHSE